MSRRSSPPLEIRLRITVRMSPGQAVQYRLEHGLAPDDDLRDHIRDLLHAELAGLGVDWWTITIT